KRSMRTQQDRKYTLGSHGIERVAPDRRCARIRIGVEAQCYLMRAIGYRLAVGPTQKSLVADKMRNVGNSRFLGVGGPRKRKADDCEERNYRENAYPNSFHCGYLQK